MTSANSAMCSLYHVFHATLFNVFRVRCYTQHKYNCNMQCRSRLETKWDMPMSVRDIRTPYLRVIKLHVG